jgi:hypothetical protein
MAECRIKKGILGVVQSAIMGFVAMIPAAEPETEYTTCRVGDSDRFIDIMATIGRRRAVAWIYNRIQLRGFIAWLAWLGLHLITLLGFRNQLNVFINWVWNYFTYDRSVRIILD